MARTPRKTTEVILCPAELISTDLRVHSNFLEGSTTSEVMLAASVELIRLEEENRLLRSRLTKAEGLLNTIHSTAGKL